MRIGELSRRTGVCPRLLRYYEEQALISPERCTNGYRAYDERFVDRVMQIKGLLDAGLSTRIIKQILPCLDSPDVLVSEPTSELLSALEGEFQRMADRVQVLTRHRDAIGTYLAAARRGAA